MTVEIRNARPEDLEEWLELWEGYLEFYEVEIAFDVTMAAWGRILDPMNALTCRVAIQDDKVIGFAHHHTHLTTWDIRPVCYLEDLFVSPDIRKGGVGRALIDDMIALGKAQDWASIYWITAEKNKTAQKLYDSYGPRDEFFWYSLTLGS